MPDNSSSDSLKITITLFVSIILGLLIYCSFTNEIINQFLKLDCFKHNKFSYPEDLLFRAINLNHQIRDNQNKKQQLLALLTDPVTWYGKKRYRNRLHLSKSKYDRFYLTKVTCDYKNTSINNYELRVSGLHRYRNPSKEGNFVKPESLFVIIENGKIKSLKTIEFDQHSGSYHDLINRYYNYGWLLTPLITFCFILILIYIPTVFQVIKTMFQKLF